MNKQNLVFDDNDNHIGIKNERQTNINKGKSIIILIILFVFILGIACINPIKKILYKNELKKQIEDNVLNSYEYDKDLYFLGKYNSLIHIEMNDDFARLDYKQQKIIMNSIASKIENIYIKYRLKYSAIDNDILDNDDYRGTFIHTDGKVFQCSSLSIKLNGDTYTDKDFIKDEIIKKMSIESDTELYSLLNTLSEVELEEILQKLESYENSDILLKEIKYKHQYDGEWKGSIYDGSVPGFPVSLTHKWIINGTTCYNVYNTSKVKNESKKYYCVIENNIIYIYENVENSADKEKATFKFEYNDQKLSYTFIPGTEHNNYLHKEYTINLEKISDNTELPSRITIKEPSIGMTKSEAENSTWGKPDKINKTTTSYGTHEQWVYSGYRYLYFDNGKLTSIQE